MAVRQERIGYFVEQTACRGARNLKNGSLAAAVSAFLRNACCPSEAHTCSASASCATAPVLLETVLHKKPKMLLVEAVTKPRLSKPLVHLPCTAVPLDIFDPRCAICTKLLTPLSHEPNSWGVYRIVWHLVAPSNCHCCWRLCRWR